MRGRRNLPVGGMTVLVLLGTVVALRIGSRSEARSFHAPLGYELVPALWSLDSIAPDGRSIWIRVATGDCSRFFGVGTVAVRRGLRVRVFNKEPMGDEVLCRSYLVIERRMVRLHWPLGDREILGECASGNATPEQRQCELIREIPWQESPATRPNRSPPAEALTVAKLADYRVRDVG